MTKELVIYQQFDALQKASNALYKSGYFKDVTSEAQAIVKVLAGAELGLPPFASMAGINIIQGKPAIGSNLIAAMVKNDARYDYRVKQISDTACVLEWFEGGKEVGTSGFSIDEAKRAGLTGKDNWTKYPSDMLFARALTRGARRFAPGIFGGAPIYTPEELGADTDEDGYIDAKAIDVTPPAQPDPAPTPELSLETAMQVKNSDGKMYGELDTATLSGMANTIARKIKDGKYMKDELDEMQYKLSAIRTLLAAPERPEPGE